MENVSWTCKSFHVEHFHIYCDCFDDYHLEPFETEKTLENCEAGDILEAEYGGHRKVLGRLGNLFFLSYTDGYYNEFSHIITLEVLQACGWKVQEGKQIEESKEDLEQEKSRKAIEEINVGQKRY